MKMLIILDRTSRNIWKHYVFHDFLSKVESKVEKVQGKVKGNCVVGGTDLLIFTVPGAWEMVRPPA